MCVLIVEGMSVVVYVMLSLMSVMSPPLCIVQPIGAHGCEVMYFWWFGFRGKLGFLNCDDVCMCVVNKLFQLLEFVSESVYVDLQYDGISLTFTLGMCVCVVLVVLWWSMVCLRVCRSTLCCGCGCYGGWDACTVVCVACVCAVRV